MEKDSKSHDTTWPGAFGLYKRSRDAIRLNLGVVVWLWVFDFAMVILLNILFTHLLGRTLGALVTDVCNLVLNAIFLASVVYVFVAGVRGKRVELEESLRVGVPLWARMVLLNLLVGVTVIGGLILLIVPGIIFGLRLSQAQYFLVDQNLSVMEAYKASWEATRGHLGKIWGIIGVYFLMLLPSITIIGIIATVYLLVMYSASYALFYEHIAKKQSPAAAKH